MKVKVNSLKAKKTRILILGDRGVGKSALAVRFMTGRYIGEYVSDEDERYPHTCHVDGRPAQLELVDTCGHLDLKSDKLLAQLLQADGIVVVYNICSKASFEYASNLLRYINRCPITKVKATVLLGNKTDLESSRQVSPQTAQSLAESYHISLREVSAAENKNAIVAAFEDLVRSIVGLSVVIKKSRRGSSLGVLAKALSALSGKTRASEKRLTI